MKKKVFITRTLLSDGPDLLRSEGIEVDINNLDRPLTYDELLLKARDYDGLITMLSDRIDESFLRQNSHLKVISNYAAGFNNIDIKIASELGIPVGNTPGVLTEATAEITLGLMISAARSFHSSSLDAREGQWSDWQPMGYLGPALYNKTLGLVGLGRIGLRVAEMAQAAFKMKIIYTARSEKKNDLNAQKVSMEELLGQSDFISLHVPLTAETKKLIGGHEFGQMKKTAVLINTARGEVIDQAALVHALKNKQIFAAGLDVTDPEPLPKEHELYQLENVLILPHIGSATFEARKAMSIMCAENIIAGLLGLELKGWVNKNDLTP